ncbi:MAG: leucine-rich repeat protein, partial [Firmicutes bacterium]|nr:leucine-rich repeat protein [Bacillota bacterium]
VHNTCYGCSSMTYLGLPNNAGSADHVFKYDNVTGCNSLDTVKVPARDLKLDCGCAANTGSGYDNIYTGGKDIFSSENLGKNSAFEGDYEVSDQFCILAYSQSYAHSYTQKHDLAFGYLDSGYEGWYEKIVDGYAFCVNENNELIRFEKKDESSDGANVIIPDNIAKYHVARIATDTFQNNTAIKFLYIPASVSTIDANAFSGCTSLRTVKFDSAASVQQIGQDAFKTGVALADVDKDKDGVPEENLCFIGDISSTSVPFTYAMSTANNYNAPSAPTQYIRYCSDFPQNLQIQLDVKKNANTNEIESATPMLVGVPTEEQLKGNGSYSLSTYTGSSKYVRTQQQENDIVASANSKYRNNLSNPNTAIDLTEEEQGVIDAVYHVHVPDGVTALKEDLFQNNTAVQSVILDTVTEIPDQEFDGCTGLKTFIMKESGAEGGEVIGKRAFNNCTALTEVTLPGTVSTFTEAPFAGCKELTDVGFISPGGYACADGLLCSVDDSGNRTGVVECLESRGIKIGASKISSSELAGITGIAPCAFQNCTGLREAYLDEISATLIPDYCFDGATQLYYCSLSDSVKKIGKYAFRNTALSTIRIPGSVQSIDDEAFITDDGAGNVNYIQGLTVQCEEDSPAYWYCDDKDGITAETYSKTYTVTFLDWDNYVLKTQVVNSGASADAPRVERKGYVLTGWTKDFTNVKEDMTTQAVYEPDNSAPIDGYYSVVFQDYDGLYTWDTQYLQEGSYPTTPSVTPTRKGYKFSYWSPSNYTTIAVTGDMIVKAYYVEDPNASDDDSGDTGNNNSNNGNNNNNNGNNNDGNNTTGTTYTVNFVDYDGSVLDTQIIAAGSCPAATNVTPTRKGYTFTTWSPSNYTSVPVTGNLTVTALYKKGTASTGESGTGDISSDTTKGDTSNGNTNNSGNSNSNTNNAGKATAAPTPTATATVGAAAVANRNGSVSSNTVTRTPNASTGNTKVEVTKSGISNRGLVSATVSGSNDNYVIKISDSEDAKNQVEQALLASYGSLDDLKYFAMDISLYDSTGTTKIADTTGITVTVTMPIPDALAGYAGNNKAGAVNNGVFEKLGSRLLTIDNVPCISFEASHFSPYAIYVETNNLTQAQISDATPKTGDPIHPKWFLAIGLAILSILLFFAKGSKNKVIKVIE